MYAGLLHFASKNKGVRFVVMADLTTRWFIGNNPKKDFTEISIFSVLVVTQMYCMPVEEYTVKNNISTRK